jgi:hypothetical protein
LCLLSHILSVLNLLNLLFLEPFEIRAEISALLLVADPHQGLSILLLISASLLINHGLLVSGFVLDCVFFVNYWYSCLDSLGFFHLE